MRRRYLSLVASLSCFSCAASAAAPVTGPAIGSIAPDFKARDAISHENAVLSNERGKVVILTFWASWCGPCRRELPILENAQRLVGRDKLTVFAVSFQENPDAAAEIKRAAVKWQIRLIEDRYGVIARHYSISSIPHLFIIDRSGRVLASHLGYGDGSIEELVADINHALAVPVDGAEEDSPPPAPPP